MASHDSPDVGGFHDVGGMSLTGKRLVAMLRRPKCGRSFPCEPEYPEYKEPAGDGCVGVDGSGLRLNLLLRVRWRMHASWS